MPQKYVLITPARNEQAFLEATIIAVLHQTIRPLLWVIVSDGSTDRTEEIVRRYSTKNRWIELINLPQRHHRHFAGKVHAFNAGYERVKRLSYDVIGNLDADVSLEDPEYFAFLLTKFAKDSQLGVAGCPFREGTTRTITGSREKNMFPVPVSFSGGNVSKTSVDTSRSKLARLI